MKKRRSHEEIQAALLASQSKPVKLRVAASLVHSELTRQGRFSLRAPEYIQALTQSAAELAQVVDIYHVMNGKLLRVPEEELANGSFADGGNLFRAATGQVYKSLSVRRIDVLEGLELLRAAHKAITAATAPQEAAPAGAEAGNRG